MTDARDGVWEWATLGDICADGGGGIQTGPFGSQLHAHDYVSDGIPVVMPQDIGDHVIKAGEIVRVSIADAHRLSKYALQKGDIVYSRRGDVEKRALVRTENEGWLCGTGCLRVRLGDMSTHDPRFVSYALGTAEARDWLVRHAVGATMPNLNTTILGSVPLRVPDEPTQRTIADALISLDDKIAVNNQISAITDATVRTEWEIMARATSERVLLGSLATSVRTGVDPTTLRSDLPYVGLEHVPRRSMWLPGWGPSSSVASLKNRFDAGDVLFGKLRPNFHKVVAAPVAGIASTDILVLRPDHRPLAGFFLATAASDLVVGRAVAVTEGTRMPRTSWKQLSSLEVPWPGGAAAERFSERVAGVGAQVNSRLAENRKLAELRDALLPALMSGRLRVRDVESAVERAT
ncbi:restriction endonuclease subunit S [Georgenia yuyongxinii]